MSRMLRVYEVAERLGVKPAWVYKAIRRGVIPAVRISEKGLYLIPEPAVDPEKLVARAEKEEDF